MLPAVIGATLPGRESAQIVLRPSSEAVSKSMAARAGGKVNHQAVLRHHAQQISVKDNVRDGVKQDFLFGENHRKLGKVAAGKSQCSCKGKVSFLACSDSDMRTKAF